MSPATPPDILRALADPTRQRILDYLLQAAEAKRRGECFGGSISQALGLTQPTVSHHMKTLVETGLVDAEKQGTTVYYRLGPTGFRLLTAYLTPYLDATRTPQETP